MTEAVRPLPKKRCWLLRPPKADERPNVCYIGLRGQGKTLRAVHDVCREMRKGVKVYSNIEVVDHRTGLRAERIYSWLDIVDPVAGEVVSDCIVFIDEAPAWVDATAWQSVPGEIKRYFRESRKHGVGLWLTAQVWTDVYKGLRDLLDFVVICEKVPALPRRFPLFRYQVAYPREYDLIDGSRSKKLEYVYWFMRSWVYASYDTYETVTPQEWKAYKEEVFTRAARERELADSRPRLVTEESA